MEVAPGMWYQGSVSRAVRVFKGLREATSIASFLWVAIPVAAAFAGTVASFASGHAWMAAYAGGAASMTVLLAFLMLYPLHPMLRRFWEGFRFTSIEITLELDAKGPRRHVRSVEFLARIVRSGIRCIPDRFCRPGPRAHDAEAPDRSASDLQLRTCPYPLSIVEGRGRVLGPLYDDAVDAWTYQIDFGASLSAGSEHRIRLTQELDFRGATYAPRLQRTIIHPTDRLVLILKVPEAAWPVGASGEEQGMGERTRSIPIKADEAHHEIRMDVSRPRFGSIYRIRWDPIASSAYGASNGAIASAATSP
jgi:hypothetical protein